MSKPLDFMEMQAERGGWPTAWALGDALDMQGKGFALLCELNDTGFDIVRRPTSLKAKSEGIAA